MTKAKSEVEQPTDAGQDVESKAAKPAKFKRFVINVSLGNDNESSQIFLGGMTGGDVLLRRGKDVEVSEEVLHRLDDAVMLVPEKQDDDTIKMIERKRFPYTIVKSLG